MDKEMEQFQKDLLESVRQMKAGKAARTTVVTPTAPRSACHKPSLQPCWEFRFALCRNGSKAGVSLLGLLGHCFGLRKPIHRHCGN